MVLDISQCFLILNIFNYDPGLDLKVGDVIMKEYIHLWDTVSKLVKKFDVGKPTPLRTTKVHFIEKTLSPIKGNLLPT